MNELIDKYLKKGFGSMNKNDFEVAIINELLNAGWTTKSNRTISLELRIPETKVKRLRYEAELKYGQNTEEIFKKSLEEVLAKAQFKADGKKLVFIVENQMLRGYLDGKLKDKGFFSDRSFNSEIVSVNAKDFIGVLNDLFIDKDIIKKAKNKTLFEALKTIGKGVIDYSLTALLSVI